MKTEAECLEYLNSINIPCLTDSDTQSCEGRLTVKECWDALRSMKNNKSPGNDGITKEFLEYFWGKLGTFLVSTLNHSFEKGELAASQKQAIITLIKKKDKDKRLIKNWRPISLIKVASKAIANRLKAVIRNLISVDQTAYVKRRFIGESMRVINDLIEHIDTEDEEGILFSTDIEKAFDSVDHNFLFATLKRYGFGTEFVNFIKTLLFDAQSCVINNGYTTDYFKLERGTRQGDPLSAYSFILVFEVLLIQVREDIDIKGFTVNDVELKLSCYADDGYFMVKTVDSIKKILRYFDIYSLYSSLKVNLEKFEACWLGRAKFRDDKPIACKWTALNNGCIRILGSFFSYDPLLSQKVNFLTVTESIHTIVNCWKQRGLTLGGRIQVFKSLIFSKLVYASSVQYISGDVVKEICKIQKDFIWRGKRPKIKHSTIIGNFENGGLKDIDIESKLKALKLSWIKRLLDSNFHPWKTLAAKLLEPVGGTKIFHSNLSYV